METQTISKTDRQAVRQEERFLDHIRCESGGLEDEEDIDLTDHFYFQGGSFDAASKNGGPRVFWNNGVHRAARVAYEILVGDVPVGQKLIRLCDEITCVRTSHHRPGPAPTPLKLTPLEDFNTKWVAKRRDGVSLEEPCHLWIKPGKDGYGQFRGEGAHRAAWQFAHPDLVLPPRSSGLQVTHLCEVRGDYTSKSCVNATHLLLATAKQNALASPNHPFTNAPEKRRGADFLAAGLCRNGLHDVTLPDARVRVGTKGNLTCRECYNARERAKYAREKAAKAAEND